MPEPDNGSDEPRPGHASANEREPELDGQLDLFLHGSLFFDIVFTGLPSNPHPGTEVWAQGMGSLPGGIANLAVSSARLGLRTGLAAGFGDDAYGDWTWSLLRDQEHIDLSRSRRFPGWHSAVTVSLSTGGDRSMITHGHPIPISARELIGAPPASRALLTDLGLPGDDEPWWLPAHESGSLVFADVGWDPSERWDPAVLSALESCHAFLPNDVEAMAYTRTSTAEGALAALAERVPFAVVTMGVDGAMAVDATTGEHARVPSLPIDAMDPTGAGDVFSAAIIMGTLSHWPLEQRLHFAALCSALAVQHFGGSLSAPGWGDIADWWQTTKLQTTKPQTGHGSKGNSKANSSAGNSDLIKRYGFLDDLIDEKASRGAVRRADATFGLLTEAEAHARA